MNAYTAAISVQLWLVAAILVICWLQARKEKTSFVHQLQKWQSSLAVVLGFFGVIWTMRFNMEREAAGAASKAYEWLEANALDAAEMGGQALDLESLIREAEWFHTHNDPQGCISKVQQIKLSPINRVGFLRAPEADVAKLPENLVRRMLAINAGVADANRKIQRLDPIAVCSKGDYVELKILSKTLRDVTDQAYQKLKVDLDANTRK